MDNRGPLAAPAGILIRGATIWTCGTAGRLDGADLLVIDGKIKAIGRNLSPPGICQ